jgi:hypothetical protein
LNIVDTIRAALANGDHMIDRERFRRATAQADIPIAITQIEPLLFGVVAAVIVHARAALAAIHSAFEGIQRTPYAISCYILLCWFSRAFVRIRSEPFLILLFMLFAEGVIFRIPIAPARALTFFLRIGHLSKSISIVCAHTGFAAYRISVGLFLVATKRIEHLGLAAPKALFHSPPHIVLYGFIIP